MRLLFRSYTPAPLLRDFIENFWLYEGYTSPFGRERIFPDGTFKIVFNLRDDELRIYDPWQPVRYTRFSGAVVSRPSGVPFVTDSAEEAAILGVNFKLGGAFPFVGVRAGELGPTHVNLREFWGPRTAEIQDRLVTSRNPLDRFRFLERALIEHLSRATHHDAVLAGFDMLGRPHAKASRTREVARRIGLSERRFIEVFKTEVGVRPKLFARVRRFQHALKRMRQNHTYRGADLAAECGYFDESHMIRDFVEFSGFTPAAYVRRQHDLVQRGVRIKPNHLPLTG